MKPLSSFILQVRWSFQSHRDYPDWCTRSTIAALVFEQAGAINFNQIAYIKLPR